jgi:hypothetical protein
MSLKLCCNKQFDEPCGQRECYVNMIDKWLGGCSVGRSVTIPMGDFSIVDKLFREKGYCLTPPRSQQTNWYSGRFNRI